MPEQALYLKWRPLTFDDVVGQEHITRTLRNSLKTGRIRHAYLFSGPRGTGKTTSARLLAKAVNCTHPDPNIHPCNTCDACVAVNEGRFLDLIEIDAASHTGVDDVRELRDRIAFSPSSGKYKVYIIDEVHRFSGNAFDALLKTLEEPPDHAIFVLATTEIDKVPATIKSRCLPFEFRRLSLNEVVVRLRLIADNENIAIDEGSLELIAREGTGSVRDSISLLDQIVADPEEKITLELTQRILGTASARAVRDLVEAMLNRDMAQGVYVINEAVDSGSDPRQFGQQIVEHLRSVLLAQTASVDLLDVSQDDRLLFAEQAERVNRRALLRAIRAFNEAVNAYTGGWQPQLALELALIESLQAPTQPAETPQPMAEQPTLEPPPEQISEPVVTPIVTGEEPLVPPDVIRDKWVAAQRIISQHASKAKDPNTMSLLPSLMSQAQLRSVDGNRLTFVTRKEIHAGKLNDPERRSWIERALYRVHGANLFVQFVSMETGSGEARIPDHIVDPREQEIYLLGGRRSEEDDAEL